LSCGFLNLLEPLKRSFTGLQVSGRLLSNETNLINGVHLITHDCDLWKLVNQIICIFFKISNVVVG